MESRPQWECVSTFVPRGKDLSYGFRLLGFIFMSFGSVSTLGHALGLVRLYVTADTNADELIIVMGSVSFILGLLILATGYLEHGLPYLQLIMSGSFLMAILRLVLWNAESTRIWLVIAIVFCLLLVGCGVFEVYEDMSAAKWRRQVPYRSANDMAVQDRQRNQMDVIQPTTASELPHSVPVVYSGAIDMVRLPKDKSTLDLEKSYFVKEIFSMYTLGLMFYGTVIALIMGYGISQHSKVSPDRPASPIWFVGMIISWFPFGVGFGLLLSSWQNFSMPMGGLLIYATSCTTVSCGLALVFGIRQPWWFTTSLLFGLTLGVVIDTVTKLRAWDSESISRSKSAEILTYHESLQREAFEAKERIERQRQGILDQSHEEAVAYESDREFDIISRHLSIPAMAFGAAFITFVDLSNHPNEDKRIPRAVMLMLPFSWLFPMGFCALIIAHRRDRLPLWRLFLSAAVGSLAAAGLAFHHEVPSGFDVLGYMMFGITLGLFVTTYVERLVAWLNRQPPIPVRQLREEPWTFHEKRSILPDYMVPRDRAAGFILMVHGAIFSRAINPVPTLETEPEILTTYVWPSALTLLFIAPGFILLFRTYLYLGMPALKLFSSGVLLALCSGRGVSLILRSVCQATPSLIEVITYTFIAGMLAFDVAQRRDTQNFEQKSQRSGFQDGGDLEEAQETTQKY